MLHGTISIEESSGVCDVCCCEAVTVRAGETSQSTVNYAAWSVPIAATGRGLGCSPQFNVEQLATCPTPTGDDPFITGPVTFDQIKTNDPVLSGNLAPAITPTTGVEFSLLPFHGPYNGVAVVNADGTFTYAPRATFTGIERFFVRAEYNGQTQIFEVLIGVDVPEPTLDDVTPAIKVINPQVNQKLHFLTFGLQVSPAVRPCDTYRLRVRMDAYDCVGTCFWKDTCYDLKISQCR